MLNILVKDGVASVITDEEAATIRYQDVVGRWDWKSFDEAIEIANMLNANGAESYIAIDRGECVSPRFDVIELPKVGDPVSKAFNGDSYPEGTIASISKSLRVITTDTGVKFYRRRQTGSWLANGTWSLIHGHHSEQNPHF